MVSQGPAYQGVMGGRDSGVQMGREGDGDGGWKDVDRGRRMGEEIQYMWVSRLDFCWHEAETTGCFAF